MSFEDIDLQWFAAEDEGRTEDPTEKKLQDARKEGNIAKSQDLCSAVVMIVTVGVLVGMAPFCWRKCEEVLLFYFTRINETEMLQRRFFYHFLLLLAQMVLPFALSGVAAAVLINLIQNRGFVFSWKPIEPNISKISPKIGQYLSKTIFSGQGAFNVLKSFAKVAFVGMIAFVIIRLNLPRILESMNAASIHFAIAKIAWTAAQILAVCAVFFLALALPDYYVQRRQHIEKLKMKKEDVKREYKEMEGDPEVKARLQSAQRELLQRNMPQQVAKSDVVITNPTHYAVALMYDRQGGAEAPQIMAKGVDQMALRIRSVANENDVPVVENRPLARVLYAKTEIGDIIPSDYFVAIAAIYNQLEKFNNKK